MIKILLDLTLFRLGFLGLLRTGGYFHPWRDENIPPF